jgi:hypothetical protein
VCRGAIRIAATRLLDFALEAMQSDPAVLTADPAFNDDLAAQAETNAEERTAYYLGRRPRPSTPHLP